MFYRTAVVGIAAVLLSVSLPAKSQSCTPLSLVGGEGTEVKKTVSVPTVPGPFGLRITRNNWNTDWIVPSAQNLNNFVATILSEEGGVFDIRMYLKYSNATADNFYNAKGVRLNAGEPLEIRATSRTDEQPYQVNLFVGEVDNIGKSYTASVVGCL